MSDFDRLRRGQFHPDAAAKASEQEALELGRDVYDADAAAKAAEQEALEARARRSAQSGGRADDARHHDRMGHTVIRRSDSQANQAPSGGAVVSRRSGLGMWMQQRRRRSSNTSGEAGMSAASSVRAERREQRRWEREQRRAARGGRRGHGGLLFLIAAIVALYVVFCLPIDRAISFTREESEGLSSELSWHVPATPYYLLALGSDAREGDSVSRTDTMILMRVDLIGGKLTMLSIPRDTMVQIEGQGTQKINAAYAFGGAAGAVHAVHELTGAPISQVAVIKFDGVETLVDFLGGVTVDVPVAVNDPEYTGLVLPAGTQEMDGHTALLFSRVRHGFDMGDYQRQKDQRILIEAIMRKMLTQSPLRLPQLGGAMDGLVGTTMRMYSILPLMARMGLGPTVYQATVPSTTAMVDGVSYVVADEDALARMMDVIDAGGDPSAVE